MFLAPAAPAFADLWGISTDSHYSRVIHFNHEDGSELSPGILTNSAGLDSPGGIAVGPDGNIYVSSRGTGQILFYDGQSGSPLTLPGGTPGVFANIPGLPAQLEFGPDGNLYLSQLFGSEVWVYDPSDGTRLPNAVDGLEPVAIGHALGFGPDGALYVGDGFEQGGGTGARIFRVEDGDKQIYGFTGAGGLYAPTSMLFLPDGDLLVVDLVGNFVGRYDENGGSPSLFAFVPPPIAPPNTHFPADIVFDPDGNLILGVLGEGNYPVDLGQLIRYDLDGNLIETIVDGFEQIGGLAWTPSPKTQAGDFDDDGDVDEFDYAKWKGDFGKWVAAANGADGNGDGVINAADYTVWRNNLGTGQILELVAGVPEPSTSLLAIGMILLALGARSNKLLRN
jgi:DNA-binding beta-propeller fold protein YncE